MENNIYSKLANVRVAVQKRAIKKSGVNKFAGFNYFELKDFLTISNEEMAKEGLCPVFNLRESRIETTANDKGEVITREYPSIAELTIYDGKDNVTFSTPIADATTKGQLPIQALGSQHTYLKRYLYMNCLELAEDDSIDATAGKEDKAVKDSKDIKATKTQIDKIVELYDEENQAKIKEYYKVDSLENLTIQQASEAIKKKVK